MTCGCSPFGTPSPTPSVAVDPGILWFAPYGGATYGDGTSNIRGFTPAQQLASSSAPAAILLDVSAQFPVATATVDGVQPDAAGDLWVFGYTDVNFNAPRVAKYRLADCLQSGTPAAVVVLDLLGPVPPNGGGVNNGSVLFDKFGNLYQLTQRGGTFGVCQIHRYRAESLKVSGAPSPDVALGFFNSGSVVPNPLGQTLSGSFDGNGALWLGGTSLDPGGGIAMLGRSQVAVNDAAIVPSVYWFGSNQPAGGSWPTTGVEFGPNGLLWSICSSRNELRAWDVRAPSSGNPAPLLTITSPNFSTPIAIAFDRAGNLWVLNWTTVGTGGLYRLPAAALGVSGSVVPDVILSAYPWGAAIRFSGNPGKCGAVVP